MLSHVAEAIGGVWSLARLGVVSRFRFRGRYWQWRWHTAFGAGAPKSRRELIAALLAYGRWVHRMRRFR